MNQSPFGQNLTLPSSLAGKRKLSPAKKSIGRVETQLGQGISRVDMPVQFSAPTTDTTAANDLSRNTSGSSSSLNLNCWDGTIDDYFDDMSNISLPLSQQADSGSNHELSITGDNHTNATTPNYPGFEEHPAVMDVPDATTREGSEKNPILLDTTPEELSPVGHQPSSSRPRRNVEPLNSLANEDILTSFSKKKTRPVK